MRVHDRMPVILANDAARRWIEPWPLPTDVLVPYPAEPLTTWRVCDDAKNSRIERHPGMAEPVSVRLDRTSQPIQILAPGLAFLPHADEVLKTCGCNNTRSPSTMPSGPVTCQRS